MGLFDVFKKNENAEDIAENQSTEGMTATPSAEEVKKAAVASDPLSPMQKAPADAGWSADPRPVPKGMTLPAITPNKLMSLKDPDIIAREDKARVLGYFIEKYNDEKTVPNLQNCVKNYAEAWLWVPMRMQFSEADAAGFKAQTSKKKYVPKDPVRLVPELLKSPNGDVVFFAFTSRDEISEAFMEKYVWMQMPSAQSGVFLVKHAEIAAIVINPFTKNLALKRDFLTKSLRVRNADGTVTPVS